MDMPYDGDPIINDASIFTVLGLTGMPGSGKGEFSNSAHALGIPTCSLGDVVRKYFFATCPEREPVETGVFANEEREKHGKDVWARRLVKEVDALISSGEVLVIIDGIRSNSEVAIFREKWDKNLKILCVHSSPGTRFSRLSTRGRNDDPPSYQAFIERDSRELGWGLGEVIASADLMIINENGMDELKKESARVIGEIIP